MAATDRIPAQRTALLPARLSRMPEVCTHPHSSRGIQPNRSQRRNLRRNAEDVRLVVRSAELEIEHYQLYERYLNQRHGDGDMAEDVSIETYARFLLAPWGGETRFIELRGNDGTLLGVAVTDLFSDGLSAVYTFFDPEQGRRALGTYAVLGQIREAQRMNLGYLYLGYWIGESQKMRYKENFRPLEAWNGHGWERFERGKTIPY